MFANRTVAGEELGQALLDSGVAPDIVLAIPRGGLPTGRAVADALDVPLDIAVAKKLEAPHNPELAIGAVASNGSSWLNDDLIDRLGVNDHYLEDEQERQAAAAKEKRDRYREGREEPEIAGRTIVLVDDGIATGATMRACIRQLRDQDAGKIIVAVPVAPPSSVRLLEVEADELYVLEEPAGFMAVGRYYRDFEQVQDREAMRYLEAEP